MKLIEAIREPEFQSAVKLMEGRTYPTVDPESVSSFQLSTESLCSIKPLRGLRICPPGESFLMETSYLGHRVGSLFLEIQCPIAPWRRTVARFLGRGIEPSLFRQIVLIDVAPYIVSLRPVTLASRNFYPAKMFFFPPQLKEWPKALYEKRPDWPLLIADAFIYVIAMLGSRKTRLVEHEGKRESNPNPERRRRAHTEILIDLDKPRLVRRRQKAPGSGPGRRFLGRRGIAKFYSREGGGLFGKVFGWIEFGRIGPARDYFLRTKLAFEELGRLAEYMKKADIEKAS